MEEKPAGCLGLSLPRELSSFSGALFLISKVKGADQKLPGVAVLCAHSAVPPAHPSQRVGSEASYGHLGRKATAIVPGLEERQFAISESVGSAL